MDQKLSCLFRSLGFKVQRWNSKRRGEWEQDTSVGRVVLLLSIRICSVITRFRARSSGASPGSGQSISCLAETENQNDFCRSSGGQLLRWCMLISSFCRDLPMQLWPFADIWTCLLVLSDGYCLSGHSHHSRNLPSCQHNFAEKYLPRNDTEKDTESWLRCIWEYWCLQKGTGWISPKPCCQQLGQ